jgi:hypothetical protein
MTTKGKFEFGDRVEAKWTDGDYYPGTVAGWIEPPAEFSAENYDDAFVQPWRKQFDKQFKPPKVPASFRYAIQFDDGDRRYVLPDDLKRFLNKKERRTAMLERKREREERQREREERQREQRRNGNRARLLRSLHAEPTTSDAVIRGDLVLKRIGELDKRPMTKSMVEIDKKLNEEWS